MISKPIINTNSQWTPLRVSVPPGSPAQRRLLPLLLQQPVSKAISHFRAPLFCFPFESRDLVCPARYILKQHNARRIVKQFFFFFCIAYQNTELLHISQEKLNCKPQQQIANIIVFVHTISTVYIHVKTMHQTISLL